LGQSAIHRRARRSISSDTSTRQTRAVPRQVLLDPADAAADVEDDRVRADEPAQPSGVVATGRVEGVAGGRLAIGSA
jgi:hypothetical protein